MAMRDHSQMLSPHPRRPSDGVAPMPRTIKTTKAAQNATGRRAGQPIQGSLWPGLARDSSRAATSEATAVSTSSSAPVTTALWHGRRRPRGHPAGRADCREDGERESQGRHHRAEPGGAARRRRYAAACARTALNLFEDEHPQDLRPREAIETAEAFAVGGKRVAALRTAAWAAHRAAREAGSPQAQDAARAAADAAASAYLHPLADAQQVKHVLGSAAHTPPGTGTGRWRLGRREREIERAQLDVPPGVRAVLNRLPPAQQAAEGHVS